MAGYVVNGEAIRDLRNRRGWIASELAAKVDVSTQFLYRVERNEERPSFDLLLSIALHLGVPVGSLIETAGAEKSGTLVIGDLAIDVPPDLVESFIKIILSYNQSR